MADLISYRDRPTTLSVALGSCAALATPILFLTLWNRYFQAVHSVSTLLDLPEHCVKALILGSSSNGFSRYALFSLLVSLEASRQVANWSLRYSSAPSPALAREAATRLAPLLEASPPQELLELIRTNPLLRLTLCQGDFSDAVKQASARAVEPQECEPTSEKAPDPVPVELISPFLLCKAAEEYSPEEILQELRNPDALDPLRHVLDKVRNRKELLGIADGYPDERLFEKMRLYVLYHFKCLNSSHPPLFKDSAEFDRYLGETLFVRIAMRDGLDYNQTLDLVESSSGDYPGRTLFIALFNELSERYALEALAKSTIPELSSLPPSLKSDLRMRLERYLRERELDASAYGAQLTALGVRQEEMAHASETLTPKSAAHLLEELQDPRNVVRYRHHLTSLASADADRLARSYPPSYRLEKAILYLIAKTDLKSIDGSREFDLRKGPPDNVYRMAFSALAKWLDLGCEEAIALVGDPNFTHCHYLTTWRAMQGPLALVLSKRKPEWLTALPPSFKRCYVAYIQQQIKPNERAQLKLQLEALGIVDG